MTEWGVLTHVDAGSSPVDGIHDAIRLARTAEDLGFESFWVAQHRFGEQGGAMPSPLVLLAAIARETTTISLGTASIAAVFDDPRRILEDAAVVDALSSGRLQLGFGSGSSPDTSRMWGIDHADRHTRFWSSVDTVVDAAVSGIGPVGSRRPVVPPTETLPQRIWVTTGSDDGVECAVARGLGLIAGRRRVDDRGPRFEDERVAGLISRYRSALGSAARVAISRPVLIADTARSADELRLQEQRGRAASRRAARHSIVGSSEQFVSGLSDDPALPLADHLLVHTRPVALPHARQVENLRCIAERVRPHL
ncbi:MAG: LLM class flavin-dependent oxidoreductase [Rhodococcus sp.]|uniref:LLM class flavin-dependent oxidoreductase n=1 Tax=Rhodococcus sp. TaxID=1831 RepID=UPI00169D011C|nr:LLM class flavin-dependent oxidoreductase [Rhodococcus sp. (in: high G+C Gram-positive bacteria)]NLV79359.1 LLM class flavin-dependent oxidoreductase [Rhodococcus sp. (in: high G+C Gram-positive bacteria)]